ncbi:hypothetical protein [Treponema sp.]|uniref:hypothetical protein n=1 Tax=Treponema sp. TaxID=166 RepID=UPI003F118A06
MTVNENFNQEIISAADEREQWFDTVELPKLLENYRLHFSCLRNIFDNLVKRSLVVPDPYKSDNRVTEISLPETTSFADNERSIVLGIRLSKYETMLDYICNFMKFSVAQLDTGKIKKMLDLNNTFSWANLSVNSTRPNTRALAISINELKNGLQPIVQSLLKDSISKSQTAMDEIDKTLKTLADFQRERYKIAVRKSVFGNPSFDREKAFASSGALMGEIKRLFSSCMAGRNFNNELVSEIVAEETSLEKEKLQKALYEKIKVNEIPQETKVTVDTHAIIMDALRTLASSGEQFSIIAEKINMNHNLLQSERKSLKESILRFLRGIFGLEEPPVSYEIFITDKRTETKKKEIISFNEFYTHLLKKARVYASFSSLNSPGYKKADGQNDSALLEYLNKQMVENNHIFAQLYGLDEFFKNSSKTSDRSKIKGLSMELMTIKNIVVKFNQKRAEYLSYVEEQEQMKKLGIS